MQVIISSVMAVIASCFSFLETKHMYRQSMNALFGHKSIQKHAQHDSSIQRVKIVCMEKNICLLFSNLAQILLPTALGHISVCCMTWCDVAWEQLTQHCFSPLHRGTLDAQAATAAVIKCALLPAVKQVTNALKHFHLIANCSLCASLGKGFFTRHLHYHCTGNSCCAVCW